MNIKDLKDEDLNSNTPVIGTQVQLSLFYKRLVFQDFAKL